MDWTEILSTPVAAEEFRGSTPVEPDEWNGDPMGEKGNGIGLRIGLLNIEGGAMQIVDSVPGESGRDSSQEEEPLTALEVILGYMGQVDADIMILQEPGAVNARQAIAMAKDYGFYANVVMQGKKEGAAGMIIIMKEEWKKVR